MRKGYTIKEIGVIQRTPSHIPYVGYVIIHGPRGGLYALDLFNMEQLLNHSGIRLTVNTTSYLVNYATRMGRRKLITGRDFSDADIYDVAKSYGIRYQDVLVRKRNAKIYQLRRNFEINDPELSKFTA